jgi:ferredoxin
MTFVITGACIDVRDQSCVAVCPVDCIYVEAEDRMCYINPEECIDCAVCVGACPVAAIYDEKDLTVDDAPYLDVNARWFLDKADAREGVRRLRETGT